MQENFQKNGLRTLATLARIIAGLGAVMALLVLVPFLLVLGLVTIALLFVVYLLTMGLIMASPTGAALSLLRRKRQGA